MDSVFVVLNGSKWQIGNGEKVRICGDTWIPTLPSFLIATSARVLDPSTKVSSFID